jgi:hypothetical protein
MVASQTQTVQVTCINKPNRDSTHEAITHIGGSSWRLAVEEAIRAIEARQWAFNTMVNGKRAEVEVRVSASRKKYLQTHADGYWNNNLLALPECRQ